MHNLAMLREDGGKAHTLSQRAGDAVHLSADVALRHARTDEALGCGVHLVAHVAGTLNSLNLLWLLGGTHFYYSLNQLERSFLLLLIGVYTQQIHNLNLVVVTIRRQEMNLAIGTLCIGNNILDFLPRSGIANANLRGKVGDCWNRAVPYYILYIHIIAKKPFLTVVTIYDANQSYLFLTELIEE